MTIDDDTPMRLADAIPLAFPQGGMTVSGLRKEAARGNLAIERIANKDFVTLRAIREMRERCRIPAREPEARATVSRTGSSRAPVKPAGITAQQALLAKIEARRAEEKLERDKVRKEERERRSAALAVRGNRRSDRP